MDEELYHYGVKGMKWGIRKARHYRNAAERNIAAGQEYEARSKAYNAGAKKLASNPASSALYKSNAVAYMKKADIFYKRGQKYVGKMLKAKVDLMAKTQTVKNGRVYIDAIADLRIDPDRIYARQLNVW